MTHPVAFITGASVRIGQAIARKLHSEGFDLWLHYRNSEREAKQLAEELNQHRNDSAHVLQGHLERSYDVSGLLSVIEAEDGPFSGRLDVLVNNASAFYPTPLTEATLDQWNAIINTNLRAPFLLSQGLADLLSKQHGSIVNITDIYAQSPLKDYPIYSVSKAGLVALTQSLAKELAPDVRTNAVAPGAILWPEHEIEDPEYQQRIIDQIPLGRCGEVENISDTVWFLISNKYINGQIIAIDGGKSLS